MAVTWLLGRAFFFFKQKTAYEMGTVTGVQTCALPISEIPYGDLDQTFAELRRVLKPGGILRLGLPDMDKAIDAYRAGDVDYFLIPDDDVKCLSGRSEERRVRERV